MSKKILECSSMGDKRFSAFHAKIVVDGKEECIEMLYQLCKRFGDFVPEKLVEAKGKTPTHIHIQGHDYPAEYLTPYYKMLWCVYLDNHPELVEYAKQFDDFKDTFKGRKTINCQADVIRQYVKRGKEDIVAECSELVELLYQNKLKDKKEDI